MFGSFQLVATRMAEDNRTFSTKTVTAGEIIALKNSLTTTQIMTAPHIFPIRGDGRRMNTIAESGSIE